MTKLTFRILLILISLGWITNTSLSAQTCTTGTLLYREDFRGNNTTDPDISTVDLIGGTSDLPFSSTGPQSGYRSLAKKAVLSAFWTNDDHTYPNDPTRGYFMYIDPAPSQMDAVLYQMQINDLCDGAELILSLWAADLQKSLVNPRIQMIISNPNTNETINQSDIIILRRATTQATWGFDQYSLSVTLPAGLSSLKFTIVNKEINNIGNDWVMDDIEVRFCANTVNATAKGSAAVDVPITSTTRQLPFTGSYVNDAKFGASLASYWIYSPTGDITNLSNWTIVDTKPATAIANGATWTHDFTLINPKVGYYRLVVGNPSNVLTSKCRAASEVFYVHK